MSALTRSAHGLSTPCGDWWHRAVCAEDPELWSNEVSTRRVALHICQRHCPVLEECRADAWARPPMDMVQAGIVWNFRRQPAFDGQLQAAPSCLQCTQAPPSLLPPSDTGACGTPKGHGRHVRGGERSCRSCLEAMVRKGRLDRAAKRRAAAATPEIADRVAVLLGEET